ncbi:sulfotransferase [Salinibacter ruber]|uniref:sulfotransferase n=1 Tax=Salinibacter ruber TaxID=146919 RepID=UPI0020744CBA|nr:sulfotransferase [Salinibacter ruber]
MNIVKSTKQSIKRKLNRIKKPKQNRGYNKVFCIGWLKTGTTSMGRALEVLGFKHCGWDPKIWRDYYRNRKIEKIIEHGRYFESFDDLPWNKYEMLDTLNLSFPDSKFILLERKKSSWKKSIVSFRKRNGEDFEIAKEVEYFEQHERYVKDYFLGGGNGREDQLLTMSVCDGEGFETLCPFLNVEEPDRAFPHISP